VKDSELINNKHSLISQNLVPVGLAALAGSRAAQGGSKGKVVAGSRARRGWREPRARVLAAYCRRVCNFFVMAASSN
jgi:hypothetical protein